jgi:hypothetical protein
LKEKELFCFSQKEENYNHLHSSFVLTIINMSNQQQQQDGVDESNIKLEKWKPEGPDSVIVALAVIAGNLDSTLQTYHKFLEANQTIKHKYGYQYKKGKRNLRTNILTALQLWRQYWRHYLGSFF